MTPKLPTNRNHSDALAPQRGERARVRGENQCREATTFQAHSLRRRSTDAENLLWRHLRDRRLQGAKFRRQRAIGPYIVDFYCAEAALAVEVDGGGYVEKSKADGNKTLYLEGLGLRVLRFWNDEVLKQTDAVLEYIAGELGGSPSPRSSPLGGEGVKPASSSRFRGEGEVNETLAPYGSGRASGAFAC